MLLKLKQNIMEQGRVKASVLKKKTTVFVEGAVVEVSESTGKKWIERGWAEPFKAEPKAEEVKQPPAQAPRQEKRPQAVVENKPQEAADDVETPRRKRP